MRRLLGAILLLLPATALGQPADSDIVLFSHRADIDAQGEALLRLELDADVLALCQPDLSDLRIHDPQGREVAWLVDGGGWRVDRRVEPRVLDRARSDAWRQGDRRWTESLRVEAPPDGLRSPWRLELTTSKREFVRTVVVRQGGRVLAGPQSLWRLAGGRESLHIDLPPLGGEPLDVVIEGGGAGWLDVSPVLESGIGGPSRRLEIPVQAQASRPIDGGTNLVFERHRGVVPDALRLSTSTLAFDREVVVWDEGPGRNEQPVGIGRVHRLPGEPLVEDTVLTLHRTPMGTSLRIVITDGDSPPLADLRIDALLDAPALVFELGDRGDVDGTLHFGGGRARAPEYDLAHLLDRPGRAERIHRPGAVGKAELGPVSPNPAFDQEPKLLYAARAGAPVDPRAWSHERSLLIADDDEALHRVRLGPADLGRLNPDRGDLRVVDEEGRQWPYLSEPLAHPVAGALEHSPRTDALRTSSWVLTLPGGEAAMQTVELDLAEPFFDRPWRLETLQEPTRIVGEGRLLRRQDPRPVLLQLRGLRADALKLVVENGDDAPLTLQGARAWLPAWDLFVAAPAGRYRVLEGQPAAERPSYELEALRRVVLNTLAPAVEPGPLRANPDHLPRLARTGAANEQRIVWAVLLLAVLILGAITLRATRAGADGG